MKIKEWRFFDDTSISPVRPIWGAKRIDDQTGVDWFSVLQFPVQWVITNLTVKLLLDASLPNMCCNHHRSLGWSNVDNIYQSSVNWFPVSRPSHHHHKEPEVSVSALCWSIITTITGCQNKDVSVTMWQLVHRNIVLYCPIISSILFGVCELFHSIDSF